MFICGKIFAQDVRIYHGDNGETAYFKKEDDQRNSSREAVKIIKAVNGIVTVHVLNPNPFFYNYEIKTEDVDIKDEYADQFADLVKMINALPDLASSTDSPFAKRTNTLVVPPGRGGLIGGTPPTAIDNYHSAILELNNEIIRAKNAVRQSDNPETAIEALNKIANPMGRGFRAAISTINDLPGDATHFNSASLAKDLDDLLTLAFADFDSEFGLGGDTTLLSLYKSAFKGLNSQLVATVNEIVGVTKRDLILRFQIPVKENKQTTVKLVITKIDDKGNATRELISEDIAVVMPLYIRKTFEVVPVVNLLFQSDRQRFYLEDNVVKSSADDAAKFSIGAMAVMNIASFGEFKEFGVGIGIGYSLQPDGKENSFFALPSISYKNIVRVGFGFGYNMAPVGLKDGAEVGAQLPANISDIEDVVDYKRRGAAVLSIAISGLKF